MGGRGEGVRGEGGRGGRGGVMFLQDVAANKPVTYNTLCTIICTLPGAL